MSNPGDVKSGDVVQIPATIQSIWTKVSTIMVAIGVAIPTIQAALVQLSLLPFLPTNVSTWINVASAVCVSTAIILHNLVGTPTITPQMANKALKQ